MFPQTELDNYKLQVELLQEKLKRSEDNRKQLEEKFETIMRKRSEQEKTMKVKSRIKYKQFLEEQRERNERNKALVKLLERVDQQAAALAARSERLKMMKLQYELYFARLLQVQSLRSVQSSPGQISGILPLNNIITNANLPVGIQDICQSSSNLSKVSPTISENWGMMATNTSPASSNLPYRFPANIDYFNGQILLSQEPLQRQVNLKSTFGGSMGPSIGYPAQIGTFADTRRNPIEFEHYKPLELNMAQGHQDILPPTAGPIRAARSDSHNRNLNEMQSLGQMSNENDFHGRPPFVGYGEQNGYNSGYPPSTMPQQSSEIHRPPYQMLTSDKLHSIKQDSSRERMPAEVNEDDKKTDAVEEDDEKLQPMSTARRDITPMDEPKQKTDGPKESMPPPMESSMKKVQDLFASDKLLNNTGRLNAERARAPVMWNFGGRIDPQDSNYPIQLGKKEKLSIENIEDAIYGERISPASKKKEIDLEKPDRQRIMEKRTFREISLPKEIESFRDTESHEEKSDSSEKEINVAPREQSPIINQTGSKPTTPVGSKPSTPISSKPPTPVGSKPSTPVGSKPSTPIKEDTSYIPPEEPRREQEATIPTLDQPSIQQYPEGYSKNYEEPIQKEDQLTDERKPAGHLPVETPSPSYSNYEYDEKKANEQVIPPQYESNNAAMQQQGADVQQEPYPTEQYQPQDYNQYAGQDYNQQQGYDYQADQYQGEYMQQGYDPNAYYGYDQQGDGQVYQQDGVNYQGEGGNYQQGDASYQQVDGTYQQGEIYPQADGGYQQGDGTYPGNESYQQGGEAYQSDPAYQNQNQQIYPEGDYSQQQYATNAYPTEYTGAEYANYDDQGTAQLNEQKTQEYAPPQPAVSSEEQQNLKPESSSNASNSPAPPEVPQDSPKKQDEKLSEELKDAKSPVPSTPAVMPPSILSTEKPAEPNPNKKKKKVNFVDSETDESSSAPKPPAAAPNNDESDFEFSSN